MSPDVLTIIRDIAIVVMAVMVTVAAAALMVVTFKLYPGMRRAARNFEASSMILLDTACRVSSLVTLGSELGSVVRDLVGRFRSRGGGEPDADQTP